MEISLISRVKSTGMILVDITNKMDACSHKVRGLIEEAILESSKNISRLNSEKQVLLRKLAERKDRAREIDTFKKLTEALLLAFNFAVGGALIATGFVIPGAILLIGSTIGLANRILIETKAYNAFAKALFPNQRKKQDSFLKIVAVASTSIQVILAMASFMTSFFSLAAQLPQLAQLAMQTLKGAQILTSSSSTLARGANDFISKRHQGKNVIIEKGIKIEDVKITSLSKHAVDDQKRSPLDVLRRIMTEQEENKQAILVR